MDLNFSEVQVTEKVSKPLIKGYTIQEVTITGVVMGKSKTGADQIEVGFINDAGEEHTEKMSVTAASMKYTMQKLKHMMTKVISEDEANKITSVESINSVLTGKKLRIKFGAREYRNQSGEVVTAATIGLPSFAEAPVEGKASGLRLSDKWDYNKIQEAPNLLDGVNTAPAAIMEIADPGSSEAPF